MPERRGEIRVTERRWLTQCGGLRTAGEKETGAGRFERKGSDFGTQNLCVTKNRHRGRRNELEGLRGEGVRVCHVAGLEGESSQNQRSGAAKKILPRNRSATEK